MLIDKKTMAEHAEVLSEKMSQWRRRIHQYPELSFQEHQTARFVVETLKKMKNIEIETGVGKTGVIGKISSGDGPVIAVRADMDALPIKEETNHDFKSRHEGVMHACGHDAHTAILLGVARLLSDECQNGAMRGTVKLLFQPSEESTDEDECSGASRLIESGVLDDVEAVFALHACPWHPAGVIQVNDFYSMANIDVFEGKIYGSGGHAGYPHLATDPVWILGHVLQAFYGMISRKFSPLDTVAGSIGEIHAGTQDNIIPAEVTVRGTLRSYNPELREQLMKEAEHAFKVAESFGGSCSYSVTRGEPALKNDPVLNRLIENAALNLYPEIKIDRGPFGMGGEDFGYMTEKIPGAMFFLGCALPDGVSRDLHTSVFDIDESCLVYGAAILAETVQACLSGNSISLGE